MAHHEQLKHCAGTPQSAFLKDMCYYLHNYSHILDLDNLMFVRMFLKPYGLGNDRFWVYFVTSIPLVGFVLVAYCALEFGYTGDAQEWSFRAFVKTATEKLRRAQ
jgi:hypothetical protein